MIYVSQGHEKSIGLEVFLKSFILLTSENQKLFTLAAYKDSLISTFQTIKISYELTENSVLFSGALLKLNLLEDGELPQTTISLDHCLERLNHDTDVLLTLPTSKDQLIDQGVMRAGYTEYLRARYDAKSTAMVFSSGEDHYLLITDHIPLVKVASTITSQLIVQKVKNTVEGYKKYFGDFEEVILAGINPHVGENGLLGDEDVVIFDGIEALKSKYSNLEFKGPYSGDTLHFHDNDKRQLKVYMFHDQGLPIFKALHGTIGLNISLGLPFLRMSVDHGTAFELYGKNCADYQGALYLLNRAISAHQRLMV
ncbi:MAG: 4-hydroxythreonine-4-phosphate dehydrogenase PdxA [Bacteriovoracaceae bacterium]|nr:4-hydroxythreonine-4-phosphate dehydrogenase PdxA [Bacteriovoracaceae bacterium]